MICQLLPSETETVTLTEAFNSSDSVSVHFSVIYDYSVVLLLLLVALLLLLCFPFLLFLPVAVALESFLPSVRYVTILVYNIHFYFRLSFPHSSFSTFSFFGFLSSYFVSLLSPHLFLTLKNLIENGFSTFIERIQMWFYSSFLLLLHYSYIFEVILRVTFYPVFNSARIWNLFHSAIIGFLCSYRQ